MTNAASYITDHLDTWTSAIKAKSSAGRGGGKKQEFYGIKKLRELILELAMRGLLVPQDPNDEPAEKLLKRIVGAREGLIRSGKIKKSEVRANEKFSSQLSLPYSWQTTTLGTIGDWGSGSTPKRDNPAYYGGSITWLKSGELNDCEVVSESSETITDDAVKSGSFRDNQPGDVLIAMYGATIGKVAILAQRAVTNQAVCGCTPFDGVFNRFLFIYLMSKRAAFHAASEGGAQPNISKIKLLGFPFPLPPLAEQHRIVAKVDELMTLCDKLEQQQEDSTRTHAAMVETFLGALTAASERGHFDEAWQRIASHFDTLFTTESSIDQLKQTILQLAVMGKLVEQDAGDEPADILLKRIASEQKPLSITKMGKKKINSGEILEQFEIPHSWRWCQVWEVAEQITSGSRDWAKHYSETGPIFVTMGNLSRGDYRLRMETVRHVQPPKSSEGSRTKLQEADLLISITGDVGNLGLIPENFGEAYINQHTCLLRFVPECRNRYFAELLRSPWAQYQFDAPQRGIKNSFRLPDVGEILIPIPPLAEQHRIVAKVDELMSLCDRLKANLQNGQTTQLHLADSLVEAAIG
jgi:type I restriction enzyme, S subunit